VEGVVLLMTILYGIAIIVQMNGEKESKHRQIKNYEKDMEILI
jgi:hypothetical protein